MEYAMQIDYYYVGDTSLLKVHICGVFKKKNYIEFFNGCNQFVIHKFSYRLKSNLLISTTHNEENGYWDLHVKFIIHIAILHRRISYVIKLFS